MNNTNNIPTPHIGADKPSMIAPSILLPGDPLRAKYIADNFLSEAAQFNSVRNMFGYTGKYNGKTVSVMGSGMGMPSVGIYSYELYKFYGVENIIRIGSAGSYAEECKILDILLADSAWSESTFAKVLAGYSEDVFYPSKALNDKIKKVSQKLNIPITEGRIHSTDVFYRKNYEEYIGIRENHKCIAAEMESFALFANAKFLNKNASCILTITDSLITHEKMPAKDREIRLNNMIKIALEAV